MKPIEIKKGLNAFVDFDDYDKTLNFPWRKIKNKNGRYYCGYNLKIEKRKYRIIWLHHLILGKPPIGKRINFIDKNPLNCTKKNLEFISHSEHGHFTHKNNHQKYLGVITEYIARIKIKNKIKIIGTYKTAHEAALAYDLEAREYFGDKAILNFE
jgi:hypothetical protein